MKTLYCILIIAVLLVAISIPLGIKLRNRYSAAEYKASKHTIIQPIISLSKAHAEAYWNALVTGSAKDWAKTEQAENKLNEYLADDETFRYLEKIYVAGEVDEYVDRRELEILYLTYKAHNGKKELIKETIALSASIEMKFNTFRTQWEGKNLTDNQVQAILETSTDSKVLEGVWKAQKAVGSVVAKDIIKLVKLRNQLASSLGYANYHTMSLTLREQSPDEVFELLDWVHQQTILNYMRSKKEIDSVLARRYNTTVLQLMPWHYQDLYFQKLPKLYNHSFDEYYRNTSLERITEEFYGSMNMPIDDVMRKSDLYSKPGKSQHALCMDIYLSLIHICRCRRSTLCRSRWSPYH
eukprot:TRINITY_DN2635_c0_g1_i22.p1 TRINITY_DN2635_c0_g1~~TRINITY_DN2635_c0_g1_i22.p1  ORF type:complete len:353 (-),score=61.15 TRINITY_DN2635_c0_g1_i22:18-1076(-)